MTPEDLLQLQYPIGKFAAPAKFDFQSRKDSIALLSAIPTEVEKVYAQLKAKDFLQTAYRPEGWTGQEVIHHMADSHINAYIRVKLTLTEDNPTIKPYIESLWAKMSDSRDLDPGVSVSLLHGVHSRLVHILNNMEPQEFERTYFHPESGKQFSLDLALALYDWHSRHHLQHLKNILAQ